MASASGRSQSDGQSPGASLVQRYVAVEATPWRHVLPLLLAPASLVVVFWRDAPTPLKLPQTAPALRAAEVRIQAVGCLGSTGGAARDADVCATGHALFHRTDLLMQACQRRANRSGSVIAPLPEAAWLGVI